MRGWLWILIAILVDMQMKNLNKEEFVHILRRQSTGFSRGSSKYRGVTLHKCGRWEARMGQFLGKKWEPLNWTKKLKNCYYEMILGHVIVQNSISIVVYFSWTLKNLIIKKHDLRCLFRREKCSGNTFSDYQVYLSWIIRQRSRSCKVLMILNLISLILIVTHIWIIFKP